MIHLLAQAANTLDAESVGKLIAILIGGGVVGGGAYKLGKKASVTIDNQPIETRRTKEFATQRELDEIKTDIAQVRTLIRETETRAHTRMDNLAQSLNELVGIVSVIRDHICKPRTRN